MFYKQTTKANPPKPKTYEIPLDKFEEVCYNIRKDVTPPLDLSVKKETKEALSKKLILVLDTMKSLSTNDELKPFFDKLAFEPIVAGGSIRDLITGLTPRDYDIFIRPNLSEFNSSDEIVDFCDLFTYKIHEHLLHTITPLDQNPLENFRLADELELDNFQYVGPIIEQERDGYEDNTALKLLSRKVTYANSLEAIPFNFIFALRPEIEKPLDIVTDFDYNLVRGWSDLDGLVTFLPEVIHGFCNQKIVFYNLGLKSYNRVLSFIQRLSSQEYTIFLNNSKTELNKALELKEKKEAENLANNPQRYGHLQVGRWQQAVFNEWRAMPFRALP